MFGRKKELDTIRLYKTCMRQDTEFAITASQVSAYLQSPFQLYCTCFADASQRDPIPDQYLEQLSAAGLKHEREINLEQFPNAVPTAFASPEEGFMIVIDAMSRGAKSLMCAPLFYMPDGMYGTVDQIVRTDGRSALGKHHYIVKEIKIARNIKKHHILQATFYNYILGKIQGYTPDTFYILNMDKKEIPFQFADHKDELFQTMRKVVEIRQGAMPSPTFGSCKYPWSSYCNKMALETRDISLIGGIGQGIKESLVKHGIKNLDDLLAFDESKLSKIPYITSKTAQRYITHAKALNTNKPIRKSKPVLLPTRNTEIYLDLEGLDALATESLGGKLTDYLIGCLVCKGGSEEYVSFVAESYDGEEQMLQEFVNFVNKQDDYAIYHWHHYERTHLVKMMDRYTVSQKDREAVLGKDVLFDLYGIATSQFSFPVPSTSIKAIAGWMGFSWMHQDVGALSSIELYLDYVDNADSASLKRVLDYNKDDCVATRIVKDWLESKNSE